MTPVVVVEIEVVGDGEEDDEEEEEVEEGEQGSLQGSCGGREDVEEKLVVELDPVELLTSLYGKTPRIGALVVESSEKDAFYVIFTILASCSLKKPCLFILILDAVVVDGNSWHGEHGSKEMEQ